MVKIISFLIKAIRFLRADIYRLSYVAKNIALTFFIITIAVSYDEIKYITQVVGRLRVGETRHISDRCVPG